MTPGVVLWSCQGCGVTFRVIDGIDPGYCRSCGGMSVEFVGEVPEPTEPPEQERLL